MHYLSNYFDILLDFFYSSKLTKASRATSILALFLLEKGASEHWQLIVVENARREKWSSYRPNQTNKPPARFGSLSSI